MSVTWDQAAYQQLANLTLQPHLIFDTRTPLERELDYQNRRAARHRAELALWRVTGLTGQQADAIGELHLYGVNGEPDH